MLEDIGEQCPVRDRINEYCSCPKTECPRHGVCCECIRDHKQRENVPFLANLPHCLRDMVKEQLEP